MRFMMTCCPWACRGTKGKPIVPCRWIARGRSGEHHSALRATAVREKPVRRPGQPEIFAQSLALVLAPEDAAPLQLRHHAVDEVVETAWQIRKLHGEAVGALR